MGLPGALGVGVAQCRTFGTLLEPQMIEFTFAAAQSITDFAQRLGLRQLVEHHRDKLAPAGEPFGRFFGPAFFDSPRELVPIDLQKHLAKKA